MPSLTNHVDDERRRRVRLALWAFAYELMDNPLVDDALFDAECYKVDLSISCDYPGHAYDSWWRERFQPHTGQWIRSHPNLAGMSKLYHRVRDFVGPGLIVK